MTVYYQLKDIPKIDLTVRKNNSYRKRWDISYNNLMFPFWDGLNLLYLATFELRMDVTDLNPILSLDSDSEYVSIIKEEIDGVDHSFYGIYLTVTHTVGFPLGRMYYLIKFKRISDNWTFKIQNGNFEVIP